MRFLQFISHYIDIIKRGVTLLVYLVEQYRPYNVVLVDGFWCGVQIKQWDAVKLFLYF